MKKSKVAAFFLIAAVVLPGTIHPCFGQAEYRFEHLDRENGLVFNDVKSIQQDNLGFIWLQHFSAYSRFDGYDTKTYQYDPDDSLRSNLNFPMSPFLVDHQGNKYLKKENTLLRYNPDTDGFEPLPLPSLGEVTVQSMIFDQDGVHLWVGTYLKGLFRIDIQSGIVENYFNQDASVDVLRNDINDIEDLGNSLLLVTLKGLWLFDKSSKQFLRPDCSPRDSSFLHQTPMAYAVPDGAGNFWLKRHPGIARYKATDGYQDLVELNDRNRESIFKLNGDWEITHLFNLPLGFGANIGGVDNEGILWGESRQMLFRYDPLDSSFTISKNDPSDPYSLKDNSVNSVLVDKDQNIWVGTDKGVSVLHKKGLRFHNINLGEATIGTSTLYQEGRDEYLVLGRTRQPGQYDKNPNDALFAPIKHGQYHPEFKRRLGPIPAYAINNFLSDGSIFWISAPGAGVFGYPIDSKTGAIRNESTVKYTNDPDNKYTISRRTVSALMKDRLGNLWVGNKRTGIDLISGSLPYGSEGSVLNFRHDEQNPNSIQPGQIYQLYPESDQSIWVVTDTGVDLFHFDQDHRNERAEHVFGKREAPCNLFKSKDGTLFLGTERGLYVSKTAEGKNEFVPSWMKAAVYGIQEDKLGRLWLYSSNGPVCYRIQDGAVIEFSSIDGVENYNAVELGGIHHTREGVMVMVDPDGISMFDPLSLQIDTGEIIPVLTHLEVNNKPVIGSVPNGAAGYSLSRDITLLDELTLDHQHNHFSIRFSAMEMTSPAKNRYRHELEGYDPDWIETDYRNRSATYTNLPAGTYTFRVKASNHHGIWSDKERTLSVVILPPPWRTWWAYTGYWMLGAGLLVLARRIVVQRELLKSNLKLAKVEQEKEHFELEKAKEVDRVKTSFFTNISHEFRTPLTLIKGPVQDVLEKYKDDTLVQSKLRLVQRNSDLLLKLINQLMDLAKLESGTLKVEKTDGDVYSFVRGVASSFESMAKHKGIALSIEAQGQQTARFDKDKVETILINLINNAIKFTPSGGSVTVSVPFDSGPPTTDHRSPITLCVKDTGIGIPSEHLTKVFERFHQVSEAHKEVGTGIGLSLVKELVTLMEGTITMKSEVGRGTEFTVTLPVEIAAGFKPEDGSVEDKAEAEPTMAPIEQASRILHPASRINGTEEEPSSKPQVLVVEDNADLRAFIIDSLGTEFHFHEAENGKQGLAIATEQIPDMIISDVMMPEMDGMEMTRRIKEDIKTSHIPLILLTAKSGEDSKLEGLSKGADDYLTKPFNKQELLLKVRNGTTRMQKLREKLKVAVLGSTPAIEVASEGEQFLRRVKETIVERMSDEQLSVESLAEDIGMSRVQLYRKVSALTGMAVNELIRKLRLQRASQLLGQDWGPVSQVAYEVGFSNLSYFSKVFKEEFGVMPSEYEKA